MKIGELPTVEYVTTETYSTVVTGDIDKIRIIKTGHPAVLVKDLPPLRDAKTDPPKQFGFFCVYDSFKLFCGIGTNFATDDGMRWADEFNNYISPAFWSEILHW